MAAGSSQTRGGPESKANALRPASTMARSSVGRLITVVQTKRLGSKALVGAPSRSRLRPVIGVHEDAGAASQFGVDAAHRLELEAAGAGPGDRPACDAVAGHEVAGMPGLVGGLGDRLGALVPAAKGVGMPRFRNVPGKDIVVPHSAWQNCY